MPKAPPRSNQDQTTTKPQPPHQTHKRLNQDRPKQGQMKANQRATQRGPGWGRTSCVLGRKWCRHLGGGKGAASKLHVLAILLIHEQSGTEPVTLRRHWLGSLDVAKPVCQLPRSRLRTILRPTGGPHEERTPTKPLSFIERCLLSSCFRAE